MACLLACLLGVSRVHAQGPPLRRVTLENWVLEKPGGRTVHLSGQGPLVVVAYSAECPICQQYVPELNRLQTAFPEFDFVLLFPGKVTAREMRRFRRQNRVEIPLLRDPGGEVCRELGATVTPEVFVLNQKAILEYAGRIDDRFPELGQRRAHIREHDLQRALEQIRGDETVLVRRTQPIGCFIAFD